MTHKKTLLPTDKYHVTIRDSRIHKGGLRLTFTIDRGEYAYRNIIEMFSLTDKGMERLQNLFNGINFVCITDFSGELFTRQFTDNKLRAEATIDRQIQNNVVKNRVIELQPPNKPEDYNVLKPKTDEYYNKGNKGKELPINDES